MSKRFLYRRIGVVIIAITLFVVGRFYKEIESFVLTPYTIIGLLSAIIGVFFFYSTYLKYEKEKTSIKFYTLEDEYSSLENKYFYMRRENEDLQKKIDVFHKEKSK